MTALSGGVAFAVVLLVVLFVLCVLLAPAVGLLVWRAGAPTGPTGPTGPTRPSRLSPSTWGAAASVRFGPVIGPIACLAAGIVVMAAVLMPLGVLAKHLQHSVDGPVFRWFGERKSTGTFDKLMSTLTIMGDRGVTEVAVFIALTVLVFAYGRRWWIPVVVVGAAFLLQRQFQIELTSWVGRFQPPVVNNGGYPSGGVSRVIGDSGTVAIVAAALLPPLNRAWRIGVVTGVFTYGLIEFYTRIYLRVHWLTDAIGGLVLGALVLATSCALLGALPAGREPQPIRDGRPGESRSTARPATSATP